MIYVFGNPHLGEDNFALDVSKHLQQKTIHCSSPEQLLDAKGSIIILDVVKGIAAPMQLKQEDLKTRSLLSMHDFDVAFFLNLMTALGKRVKVTIIGIPQTGDPKAIAQQVNAWL